MKNVVGTFRVDAVFGITGRGLALIGELSGEVDAGNQLIFENGFAWTIKSVEAVNKRNQFSKIGLLMMPIDASTQQVLPSGIIGTLAQVVD